LKLFASGIVLVPATWTHGSLLQENTRRCRDRHLTTSRVVPSPLRKAGFRGSADGVDGRPEPRVRTVRRRVAPPGADQRRGGWRRSPRQNFREKISIRELIRSPGRPKFWDSTRINKRKSGPNYTKKSGKPPAGAHLSGCLDPVSCRPTRGGDIRSRHSPKRLPGQGQQDGQPIAPRDTRRRPPGTGWAPRTPHTSPAHAASMGGAPFGASLPGRVDRRKSGPTGGERWVGLRALRLPLE